MAGLSSKWVALVCGETMQDGEFMVTWEKYFIKVFSRVAWIYGCSTSSVNDDGDGNLCGDGCCWLCFNKWQTSSS